MLVAARIETTPRVLGRLGRHLLELLRLVAEHDRVGLLGQLGARAHGLAADRCGQRLRLAGVDVRHEAGSPIPLARAELALPAPMNPSFIRRRSGYCSPKPSDQPGSTGSGGAIPGISSG